MNYFYLFIAIRLMLWGMCAIFLVMGTIALTVYCMTKFSSRKKEKN